MDMRWVRVVLGPLPATLLLLPILFAGGLGAAIALGTAVIAPGRSAGERWSEVTSTGVILVWIAAAAVGLLALWIVVLAYADASRQPRARWMLAAALLVGVIAATRWLWVMAAGRHHYDVGTWAFWLAMLLGPIALALYYVVALVREARAGTP